MFKPKTKKTEVEEDVIEIVEAPEEEIEDENESEEETKKPEDIESKVVEEEKPTPEQRVNLTQGEIISIIEFNLHRAIQSLQLLK